MNCTNNSTFVGETCSVVCPANGAATITCGSNGWIRSSYIGRCSSNPGEARHKTLQVWCWGAGRLRLLLCCAWRMPHAGWRLTEHESWSINN